MDALLIVFRFKYVLSRCTLGILRQTIVNFNDDSSFSYGQDKEYLILPVDVTRHLVNWQNVPATNIHYVIKINYSLAQNAQCASTVLECW